MLSFSSGKAADNQQKNSTELTAAPNTAQTQVVTSTQNVIAQVTPPVENEEWELEGIEEAIKEFEKNCQRPEASVTNALLVASAVSTTSVVVTDAVYSEDGVASTAALTVSGLNLASAGFVQLKEYYEQHTKIQTLQHKFIEEIVKSEHIEDCYHESTGGTITKRLTELTPANIIKFLAANTSATIKLRDRNASFTLRNNGMCSARLGGAAVASFAATAISTGIFVSQSLASQAMQAATYAPTMSPTMMSGGEPAISPDIPLAVTAALVASSIPFMKLWGGFVRVLYNQELNLLQAMKLVTDSFYKGFNNFGKLPKTFLCLFTGYISSESMEINKHKINLWEQKKVALRIDGLESQVKELQEKFEQQQVIENGDEDNQEEESTVLLSKPRFKG